MNRQERKNLKAKLVADFSRRKLELMYPDEAERLDDIYALSFDIGFVEEPDFLGYSIPFFLGRKPTLNTNNPHIIVPVPNKRIIEASPNGSYRIRGERAGIVLLNMESCPTLEENRNFVRAQYGLSHEIRLYEGEWKKVSFAMKGHSGGEELIVFRERRK